MMGRVASVIGLGCVLVFCVFPAAAQESAQFVQIMRQNQEALRKYSWKSEIRVSLDGELQSTQLYQIRYDFEGEVERTLLSEGEKKKVRGPVRKRMAKKKQKKSQEYRDDLRELIERYTHLKPAKIMELHAQGKTFVGTGTLPDRKRVVLRDVQWSGDVMELQIDTTTQRMKELRIDTAQRGAAITLVANYRTLDDGPSYPAKVVLETEQKEKPLVIEVENFDYILQGE